MLETTYSTRTKIERNRDGTNTKKHPLLLLLQNNSRGHTVPGIINQSQLFALIMRLVCICT